MESYLFDGCRWLLSQKPKDKSKDLSVSKEESLRVVELARAFSSIRCSEDFNSFVNLSKKLATRENDAFRLQILLNILMDTATKKS